MPLRRIAIAAALLTTSCLTSLLTAPLRADAGFVTVTLTVTDFDAPSDFSFSVFTALIPTLDAPVQATLSFTGTMTDFTGNGVSIGLVSPHGSLLEGSLESLLVAAVGAAVSVSDAESDPGEITPFSGSTTVLYSGGLPPYDSIGLDINFHGSGGSDVFFIDAKFEVVPAPTGVPEPATFALLGAGALLLAARVRRRAR
jgi:hypothetical protein